MIFYNSPVCRGDSFVLQTKTMKPLPITRYLIGMLMIPASISAQTAGSNIKNNKNKEIVMNTAQQNKAIVLKIYEQCINKRNFDLLNEIVSEEYTGIQGKKGAAGFQEPMQTLIKSFPDMQWILTNLIAEDDKVFASWKVQGTHANPFNNLPGTGKTISSEGMGVLTLKNGKVISTQVLTDRLGFLQALEVLPADINVLYNRKTGN